MIRGPNHKSNCARCFSRTTTDWCGHLRLAIRRIGRAFGAELESNKSLIWPAPARADFSIHAKSEHGPRGQFRGREPRRKPGFAPLRKGRTGRAHPCRLESILDFLGVDARLPEAAIRR